MPFITEPPWAKIGQRAALAARYVTILLIGIAATLLPGQHYLDVVGAVLVSTAASSTFGVLSQRYRWEWVALIPMMAGLLGAAVILVGRADGVVVLLVLALGFTLADRFIHLTRVATRQRRFYRHTTEE